LAPFLIFGGGGGAKKKKDTNHEYLLYIFADESHSIFLKIIYIVIYRQLVGNIKTDNSNKTMMHSINDTNDKMDHHTILSMTTTNPTTTTTTTTRVPTTTILPSENDLLARVSAFLPQLQAVNQQIISKTNHPHDRMDEHLFETDDKEEDDEDDSSSNEEEEEEEEEEQAVLPLKKRQKMATFNKKTIVLNLQVTDPDDPLVQLLSHDDSQNSDDDDKLL
jgi:hypothetical protein